MRRIGFAVSGRMSRAYFSHFRDYALSGRSAFVFEALLLLLVAPLVLMLFTFRVLDVLAERSHTLRACRRLP